MSVVPVISGLVIFALTLWLIGAIGWGWGYDRAVADIEKEKEDAAKKGEIPESDLREHSHRDCCGQASQTGCGDCAQQSGEVKKKESEKDPTPIEMVWAFHHLGQLTGIALSQPTGQERGAPMLLVDPRYFTVVSNGKAERIFKVQD